MTPSENKNRNIRAFIMFIENGVMLWDMGITILHCTSVIP